MSISDWQRATAFPTTAMGTLEMGVRPWQLPVCTFDPIDLKRAIGWHKHSFFECGGVWPKSPLWCKITHLLHIMMIIKEVKLLLTSQQNQSFCYHILIWKTHWFSRSSHCKKLKPKNLLSHKNMLLNFWMQQQTYRMVMLWPKMM